MSTSIDRVVKVNKHVPRIQGPHFVTGQPGWVAEGSQERKHGRDRGGEHSTGVGPL